MDEAAPSPGAAPWLDLDRSLQAELAQLTHGISPAAIAAAYLDWWVHLAISPGKQLSLLSKASENIRQLALLAAATDAAGDASGRVADAKDRRFAATEWQGWPYSWIHRSFLLNQQWWESATTGVEGVTRHHEQVAAFIARQLLDTCSPSNFLLTNPEVQARVVETGGANLWQGGLNRIEDAILLAAGKPSPGTDAFRPGHEVAITPGKVVYANRLIELIQYAPRTPSVHSRPVLIVPSWIMKFYVLDLSPRNSLVKFLVERGHTVFIVSWKNPDAGDRDLGMDDYLKLGVMAAIDEIGTIVPGKTIQGVGYCLGGTLLAIAAATMARDDDARLASLTLLAASLDFDDPGELGLFIDESQLAYLDALMSKAGYLDGKQMAGAFSILNSRDLVWSRIEREYLMGTRLPIGDLNAWNADATRMPFRQHHEYLRHLYLENDLAEGRYVVDGKPVVLTDIRVPIFALGTQRDTVSPWRSVYKVHLLTDTEVTFCLTSGGHNVGIVNPPGPGPARAYRVGTRAASDYYVDPASWEQAAPTHEGSWWPTWAAWLGDHGGARVRPPSMGGALAKARRLHDAPGRYVLAN
ncbi:MAG: alpha/beta fold hydrolase [Caldimonas sp.]